MQTFRILDQNYAFLYKYDCHFEKQVQAYSWGQAKNERLITDYPIIKKL